ncbi:MAG: tetratricopeptide repeat protein, partial [Alphaproteobacteria bacterium]|nr:tetratricopeptide repeat protein [Alphaproteobacteria bacterium]
EAALQKAVTAAPTDIGAWLHLSEVQLRGLRNGASAEASARKAIAVNRMHVDAWMALAAALAAQTRADDAVAAFNQAAQLAPTEPQPLLALARYQASRTQIDAAIAALDRLIAALPATGQAYLDRGDLLLMKNDAAGAIDAFRAAIKADPAAVVGGQFRLGTLHQAMQQWPEAETAYRAAIEKRPDFSAAYNNLAYMLAERRDKLDDALRLASRAVELEPRAAPYLDTLGWVQRARGDLPAAAAALERAVGLQPRGATFHYHLGIIQAEQGRKAEAEASLRRVLELDPKFRQAPDVEQRLKQLGAKP